MLRMMTVVREREREREYAYVLYRGKLNYNKQTLSRQQTVEQLTTTTRGRETLSRSKTFSHLALKNFQLCVCVSLSFYVEYMYNMP